MGLSAPVPQGEPGTEHTGTALRLIIGRIVPAAQLQQGTGQGEPAVLLPLQGAGQLSFPVVDVPLSALVLPHRQPAGLIPLEGLYLAVLGGQDLLSVQQGHSAPGPPGYR